VRSFLAGLRDLLILVHGPLAGLATGLVLLAIGADAWATTAVGGVVSIALILLAHFARSGERSRCEHAIAKVVRGILDRRLTLTRIDPVGFDDFMTLRDLAADAVSGRLGGLIVYGGPAQSLSEELKVLATELENAVTRCYIHLPARGKGTVDVFANAMAAARDVSDAMWTVSFPPNPSDRPQHEKELYDQLGNAILNLVSAGDRFDEAFDPQGFARSTVDRAKSRDTNARREGHAAAVLLKNARDASYVLGVMHVQQPVNIEVDRVALTSRVAQAYDLMLHANADEYQSASDAARTAHRRLTYEDLGASLEALRRLERMPNDAEADALMRERLGRFHTDLAALEAIRR